MRKRPITDLLLAVPRVAPDYELGALMVLMKPKPHRKEAIAHRSAEQAWDAGLRRNVEAARQVAVDRLGYAPELQFPDAGDYRLVLRVPPGDRLPAMAFAVVLSQMLPETWLVFGRVFLRGGRFYRRERGFKLNLVPATNVHLPRELRAAIRNGEWKPKNGENEE